MRHAPHNAGDTPRPQGAPGIYRQQRRSAGAIEPPDVGLAHLLTLWEAKYRASKIPDFAQSELLDVITRAGGMLHIIDTSAQDPRGYFFQFWGSAISLDNFANYQGVRLGEFRHPWLREMVQRDYRTTVSEAGPIY